jgi:predicted lipoprotein with Yx(FWY)xxD motif
LNCRIVCWQKEIRLMGTTVQRLRRSPGRRLLAGSLVLGAAAAAAACSSSSSSGTAAGSSASAPASAATAAVTISTKSLPGVGTALVNAQGKTLYLLTSDKGGKITCTEASGCLKAWPETALAAGMTSAKAGSGVQASLLGTVKDASGNLEVTYNHWPLYTFAGDSGPGQVKGQALTAFGGTWYVLDSSGNPVTTKVASGSSPSTGGGGNGY